MTYALCFIISTVFAFLANAAFKKNLKKIGFLLLILVILIPSIVAGLRALDVGIDINVYVTPTIYKLETMSLSDYFFTYDLEIGYKVLIYISHLISPDVNFSLFTTELLVMIFIGLFAYKYRDKANIGLTMLIFFLSFYCYTYTFMRQSIAVAIILYSTLIFQEKKYFKTFLLFLLALSFHNTAILSVFIYIFIFLFKAKINSKSKMLLTFSLIAILIMSVLLFQQIIYLSTNILGILPDKFFDYSQSLFSDSSNIHWFAIIYEVFWIVFALIYKKFAKKESNVLDANVIILLFLISFASILLSHKIINLDRIRFYFFYPALFNLVPNIKYAFKNEYHARKIITSFVIIFMVIYWCFMFPIINWSEEYPYRSDIVQFLH